MIGSARPKSLKDVNSKSFYVRPCAPRVAGGLGAGFRHPAWPGLSVIGMPSDRAENRAALQQPEFLARGPATQIVRVDHPMRRIWQAGVFFSRLSGLGEWLPGPDSNQRPTG